MPALHGRLLALVVYVVCMYISGPYPCIRKGGGGGGGVLPACAIGRCWPFVSACLSCPSVCPPSAKPLPISGPLLSLPVCPPLASFRPIPRSTRARAGRPFLSLLSLLPPSLPPSGHSGLLLSLFPFPLILARYISHPSHWEECCSNTGPGIKACRFC